MAERDTPHARGIVNDMIRRILAVLALAAMAVSTLAQETRFAVERIEVRNAHRVSPRVIVAETLLREGRTYSMSEVGDAVARLRRLPFLFAAAFTMEDRVLVIDVTEMRTFSFLGDARQIELERKNLPDAFDEDFSDPTTEWKDAVGGVRWLSDGAGLVHLGMTVRRNRQPYGVNYSAWELGYTRYDLFGTRVFAMVDVRTPVDSISEGTFTPEFMAGVPLTAHQTLTLDVQDTLFRRGTRRIAGFAIDVNSSQRVIAAAWTYDSTSEPWIATRGTFVRVAPHWTMKDRASFRSILPTRVETIAEHLDARGVDFAATHHHELSARDSVSAGLLGGWDVEDRRRPSPGVRSHPAYEIVTAGYSRKIGASLAGVEARLGLLQPDLEGPGADRTRSVEALVTWARRSTWGALRLGLGFAREQ